ENAEGQPDLFQAAVAADSWGFRFGAGRGTDSESVQHDGDGNDRGQFNPGECGESPALVERGHISQGIASRLVATPESRSACCNPAELTCCTLPSPNTTLPAC